MPIQTQESKSQTDRRSSSPKTENGILSEPQGPTEEQTDLLESTEDLLDEIESLLEDTTVSDMAKIAEEFDPATNVGYTLADAMREGASMCPQAFGGWTNGAAHCALGSAYMAVQAKGYA